MREDFQVEVKDVEHIARLARLALTAEEKTRYAGQLSKLIDHFRALEEVDTEAVEPLAHALTVAGVMREDEVVSPPGAREMLANAPAREGGFFQVPRIGD